MKRVIDFVFVSFNALYCKNKMKPIGKISFIEGSIQLYKIDIRSNSFYNNDEIQIKLKILLSILRHQYKRLSEKEKINAKMFS